MPQKHDIGYQKRIKAAEEKKRLKGRLNKGGGKPQMTPKP